MTETLDKPLYIGEGNNIIWENLHDTDKKRGETGYYINDATVKFTLKDSAGTAIASEVSMSYVTGSNGKYKGVLTATNAALLTEGETYYVECTATKSGYEIGFRRTKHVAQYHGAQ